jgi:hypothetical protein
MDLADALSTAAVTQTRTRRGPAPECEVYGEGTVRDYLAVDARRKKTSWAEAQATLDALMGVKPAIKNDKFRYHWRGRCSHFDAIRSEIDALREAAE